MNNFHTFAPKPPRFRAYHLIEKRWLTPNELMAPKIAIQVDKNLPFPIFTFSFGQGVVIMQSHQVKDSSGKEIFEFDICDQSLTTEYGSSFQSIGLACFSEKGQFFSIQHKVYDWMEEGGSLASEPKVIGNLLENPNVLKKHLDTFAPPVKNASI